MTTYQVTTMHATAADALAAYRPGASVEMSSADTDPPTRALLGLAELRQLARNEGATVPPDVTDADLDAVRANLNRSSER